MRTKTVIVGARGSLLSVCQTRMVIRLLRAKAPGLRFIFKKIITLGDRVKQWQRTDTGIFVKELEDELQLGEIDMAVHSVKDLPSQAPDGLVLAAVIRRQEPRDALITREENNGIAGLKRHAVVGTTSLRRKAQLLRLRPDLVVRDLRGNLDTRIRKLQEGCYDAIIVAGAGLERLGVRHVAGISIPIATMLPACGQGALGIEIRAGDKRMERLVGKVDHAHTRSAVSAERSFLHHTQAGCRMPVAAYATVKGTMLSLMGMVISIDGANLVQAKMKGKTSQAHAVGKRLARHLLKRGGAQILEEIRRDQE